MESPFVVSIYESRLWRRNPIVTALMGISFERELECIARAARLEEASEVLDLACGPGIYSRPLARRLHGGRIVGLDYSPAMLAYAQRRARAERVPNLDLLRGNALSLPFRSATFDVVNCCGALHLFPDVPQALKEVHRVLVEGGRFTTAVVRADDTDRGRRAAATRDRLLGLHSFTRRELEERLEQAGLAGVEVLHEHRFWMLAVAERR